MNARQIALVTWAAIVVVVLLAKSETRGSLVDVIKSMLAWQLLTSAAGNVIWNAGVVYLLHRTRFWNVVMWWDTVVFVLFGSIALIWRMTDQKDHSGRFYAKAALTNLGIGILLGTFVSRTRSGSWQSSYSYRGLFCSVPCSPSRSRPKNTEAS